MAFGTPKGEQLGQMNLEAMFPILVQKEFHMSYIEIRPGFSIDMPLPNVQMDGLPFQSRGTGDGNDPLLCHVARRTGYSR